MHACILCLAESEAVLYSYNINKLALLIGIVSTNPYTRRLFVIACYAVGAWYPLYKCLYIILCIHICMCKYICVALVVFHGNLIKFHVIRRKRQEIELDLYVYV